MNPVTSSLVGIALMKKLPRAMQKSGLKGGQSNKGMTNKLKILVACEYSGAVRDSLIALGHDAISCDLLPAETPGPHHQGDVREILDHDWDMVIAFPPCTDICTSGAKHFAAKRADGRQQAGIDFFMLFANCKAPMVAIENPIGIMSTHWRKPDQIINPFQFGHEARKPTCLWLKNLPKLTPTKIVSQGEFHVTKGGGNKLPKWYNLPPSADRWKIRSATFKGIAEAMATQWTEFALSSQTSCQSVNAAGSHGAQSMKSTMQTAHAKGRTAKTNNLHLITDLL